MTNGGRTPGPGREVPEFLESGPVRVGGVQRGGDRVPGLGPLGAQCLLSAARAARQLHELEQALGEHQQVLCVGHVLGGQQITVRQRAQRERSQYTVTAQRPQQPLALAVGQRRRQRVEHRLCARTESRTHHGPYGAGQLPQCALPLPAGRNPAGQFRTGGIRVVVLGQHPQQAGRRCLDQLTDQRCIPAGRQQPLPYSPGTQFGEADEFDGPGGQLLTQAAVTLPCHRRIRCRPHDAQQLREFLRHARGQFRSGILWIGEIYLQEHRIGHPLLTLDRAQVHQHVEHRTQVPVCLLEPHSVSEVRADLQLETGPVAQVHGVTQPRPGHRVRQAVERVQHVLQHLVVDVEEHRLNMPATARPDQGLPQLETRVEGAQPQLKRVGQHRPGLGHRVQPALGHPDEPRLLRPLHQQSQPRQVRRGAHSLGPVPGAQHVHQLAGVRHPQPPCGRYHPPLVPRPLHKTPQLRHSRRRLGPSSQFTVRRQYHRQLRLGPGPVGQDVAVQPPIHDRVKGLLVVGDVPALSAVREPLQRRPVHDVHALLGSGHRPELRQAPASTVRHRRRIPLLGRVHRAEGFTDCGTARVRQLHGMQKAQEGAQRARTVAAFLSGKLGDLLGEPGQQQFLHMPRLPQPQPTVDGRPVPVVQRRLGHERVHRRPLLRGPPNQPVDQQPARRLELLLSPGLIPHPHEFRPACPQPCSPSLATLPPNRDAPSQAEDLRPTTDISWWLPALTLTVRRRIAHGGTSPRPPLRRARSPHTGPPAGTADRSPARRSRVTPRGRGGAGRSAESWGRSLRGDSAHR